MTFAEVANHYAPKPDVLGPYSTWPLQRTRRRAAKSPFGVVAAGRGAALSPFSSDPGGPGLPRLSQRDAPVFRLPNFAVGIGLLFGLEPTMLRSGGD